MDDAQILPKKDIVPPNLNASWSSMDSTDTAAEIDDRQCWICFANSQESPSGETWTSPCKCRGSGQWVHQGCLQRWVDEKQRGDDKIVVRCDRCKIEYKMRYAKSGLIICTMERLETLACFSSRVVIGLFLAGGVYWCSVTWGAMVVFVTLGHAEGQRALLDVEPGLLLFGLGLIPPTLLYLNSFRLSDRLVSLLARLTLDAQGGVLQQRVVAMRRRRPCLASLVAQGLLLPFFGRLLGDQLLGRWWRPSQPPIWHRVLVGSVAFLALRSGSSIVLRYAQLARQATRHILDWSSTSDSAGGGGVEVQQNNHELEPVVNPPENGPV